ncbi:PQQ-binding-like beta-propeller repeat protein [Kineosporia rhizophila]|uniref:outer membrane protein assembly factor BamB family protein n=1 Tax=Kineosporia rhizophila TaxID=84633 RepID=UPI001E2A2B31|nr:PQQ-binding-like beta-propeller repeat protein [Kineosporia rhizophila]MCE0536529.1 PQQ-binding-like beta-propeller repeat protein [Kineosporia rhizophila]
MDARAHLRRTGLVVILLALITGAGPASTAASRGGDWGQTDHDAARSRSSTAPSQLTPSTVTGVRAQQKFTGGPVACETEKGFEGAPVVSGNRLYALRTRQISGTVTVWLTARSLRSGALIWQKQVDATGDNTQWGELTVSGDRLLAVGLNCRPPIATQGRVHAFSTSDGRRLWQSREPGPWSWLSVSGRHVVTTGSSVEGGYSAVLDVRDGSTSWVKFSPGCGAGLPVVVRSALIMTHCRASGPSAVASRRLSDGRILWKNTGRVPLVPIRAAADGSVVITGDSRFLPVTVAALNARTGALRYRLKTEAVLAVGPELLFTRCGNAVCDHARLSGERVWQTRLPAGASEPAVVAAGVLYLADGTVIDADSGAVLGDLWKGTADELTVARDRVVVTTGATMTVYGR